MVQDKQLGFCLQCDLAWTEDFKYPNYKNYHRDETYNTSNSLFDNAFLRLLHIAQKYLTQGKMFEVGTSVGNLLEIFFQNGWEVSGIESSQMARNIARRKGFKVQAGYFETANIPKNMYDLVVINQTLEHLRNPLFVLKKIKRILKRRGMVLIGVPNFGSLSAKALRQYWYYILPSEHKWHFSPQSLKRLVIKAGLRPIEYQTASGVFDYADPLKEIWTSFIGLKKRFLINFITIISSYLITKINKGTGLVLLARNA
jgi:2-polyprenyl-3-methyl-5-hydroxy-6-metoxy-1,4-benzoquinol methylase